MEPLDSKLASNAKQLPKLWEILGADGYPRDVLLKIDVFGQFGEYATFTIKNAPACLLSLLKVTITRELMRTTKADNIHEVVKKYSN